VEYRLIRHATTGTRLVIGSDGYLSAALAAGDYLTEDGVLRADWWRVARPEYNTALWVPPLWTVEASHGEASVHGVPLCVPALTEHALPALSAPG
jgi:hypothetical protein